jgi:membrane-associated phospholipid phosphatase
MAYWLALISGLFTFRPRLAVLAAVAAVWIGYASIATGQHHLTDLLSGAAAGVLIGVLVLRLRSRLRWMIRPTALFFEGRPMIAYPFGCWLILDLTRQFSGLTQALGVVFNVPVGGG